MLRHGVTTVRDLGWPLAAPLTGGPHVLRAGQILTAPGGYPFRAAWAPRGTAREVLDDDDARAAVAEQHAAGSCVIKIAQEPRAGVTMPAGTVAAICSEAHARGLRVTSHCGSIAELQIALDAGVDELAHGVWSDEHVPDALLDEMHARGTAILSTLHIDPSESRLSTVARYAARGGLVLYGTDMGNPPVPGGIDAEEIRSLGETLGSLEAALASATSSAAGWLGLDDRGRIEPGARADVVVVAGDPRTDVRALERVSLVMRAGEAA